MKRIALFVFALMGFWPAMAPAAAQPAPNQGLVAAYSDGNGTVELMWPVPNGTWPPAGYAIRRVDVSSNKTETIARGLRPGADAALLTRLPGQQSDVLKKLAAMDRRAASGGPAKDFDGAKAFLFISAVRDFQFAEAMGVAFADHPDGSGPYVYELAGGDGKVLGTSLPVDPRQITPTANPPQDVRAVATPEGVLIYWSSPQPTPGLPVALFRVKRDDGAGPEVIGQGPILPGGEEPDGRKKPNPRYVDTKAPVERTVHYVVVGKDVFGRESAPSRPVEVFVPDYAASAPPRDLAARVGAGLVTLSWQPSKDPRTAGYVLQRSAFPRGPYASLTDKPLSPGTSTYDDSTGMPGARYYYRILAIGPRNRVGDPSLAVAAVYHAAGPPAAPQDLHAKLAISSVVLRWATVRGAASYVVEKRSRGASRWSPVTPRPTPENRYDDPIVPGMTGTLLYRVAALGGDGQRSEPSRELAVTMPADRPPPAPHLTRAEGLHGVVTLTFIPGGDGSMTSGFYVLRNAQAHGTPSVLNLRALPASARSYKDSTAVPGMTYRYRVVAVDKNGNRSEPSDATAVRVGEALLQAPPAPVVKYRDRPYPAVTIGFPQAPAGVSVVVERKAAGEKVWTLAAGPLPPGATSGIDAKPVSGAVEYRLYYRAATGADGPPSPAVTVNVP